MSVASVKYTYCQAHLPSPSHRGRHPDLRAQHARSWARARRAAACHTPQRPLLNATYAAPRPRWDPASGTRVRNLCVPGGPTAIPIEVRMRGSRRKSRRRRLFDRLVSGAPEALRR